MRLDGKIALVTGGSRGIGRAICLQLARQGATVWVNYVANAAAAEEVAAAVAAEGGLARTIGFDVADGAAVAAAMKEIADSDGAVDILVNNAGITRDGLLARMKEEDWAQVLATNLTGAMHCTKAVLRPMMKRRWGRIVIVTSVIGFTGNAGQANYAAAKAGLLGFCRSVAREAASRNITVNCVAPGYIETDMTSVLSDEIKEKILANVPAARFGRPEDVAAAVGFLASEAAGYITGSCIHVNGGMFMG